MTTIFDFTALKESLQLTHFMGEGWIIAVLLTTLLIFVLSRNTKDIAVLFLPVYLAITASGVYVTGVVNVGIITLATFAMILATLSVTEMGTIITASPLKYFYKTERTKIRQTNIENLLKIKEKDIDLVNREYATLPSGLRDSLKIKTMENSIRKKDERKIIQTEPTFEEYKQKGARNPLSEKGAKLRKAFRDRIHEMKTQLGRDLTDLELKEAYIKAGNEQR